MRTKIEYTINNRSKLVEKLILFEDKNNSQFNNESYQTWKRLAEECSKSGDISMFANGYREDYDEVTYLKNRLKEINKAVELGEDPESVSWEKEKIFNRLQALGVDNWYDESLKESAAMDAAKKLEDDGWTVLSKGIRGGDTKHYWLARRMNKERGKADWKAIDDETGNVIDISYDQALGREPIGVSSGVSKLSKQLGKMLLPKDESLTEGDYDRQGFEDMYLVCWDDQLGDYHEGKVKASYPQEAIDKVTKRKNVYKIIDCKKIDLFISPSRIRKAEVVESLKESIHDWPVVIDNTHIQLPISENELIYFIETNFLNSKYNIDFIDEVKLATSGVDEANRKYYNLKVSGFLKRENKMFKVPVRVWENGDIEDSRNPLPPVENVIEESSDKWAVVDDNSGDILDVFYSKDEAKASAAETQELRDSGMYRQHRGPFVVEPYYESLKESSSSLEQEIYDLLNDMGGYTDYQGRIDAVAEEFGLSKDEAEGYVCNWIQFYDEESDMDESLKESAAMDSAQKLEDDGWTVLSHGIYSYDRKNHYWIARKVMNGKGVWKAINSDTGEIRDITYKQAIGDEPIETASGVDQLSKEVGKKLLPTNECKLTKEDLSLNDLDLDNPDIFGPDYLYEIRAYFDSRYRGLEDVTRGDDWEYIKDYAHQWLQNGDHVLIKNLKTGKEVRLSPDDYDAEFDFPCNPEDLEEALTETQDNSDSNESLNESLDESLDFGQWSQYMLNLDPGDMTKEDKITYRNWLDDDKQQIFDALKNLDQELLVAEHKFNGWFWNVFDADEKMIDKMHDLKQRVGTEERFDYDESLNEARYSDAYDDEVKQRGWWYFTTHGVQPGSLPKDLHVLETKDGKNDKGTQGTFVRLDGILNTNELKDFDMKEMSPLDEAANYPFSSYDFINYNDFLANNFDGWSDDIDYLIKDISRCARALKTVSNKLVFYVDYDEDFYAIDDIAKVINYIGKDYSLYQLNDLSGIYFVFGSDNLWIFKNEKEANHVISSIKSYMASLNENLKLEGLVDISDDFRRARENWNKLNLSISFDDALEQWNEQSDKSEPIHWYAKPIYSVDAWDDMVKMFTEPQESDIDEESEEETLNPEELK